MLFCNSCRIDSVSTALKSIVRDSTAHLVSALPLAVLCAHSLAERAGHTQDKGQEAKETEEIKSRW